MAIGTRTQVELGEVLDIRQSSISDAKRRDSIPAEWFVKLFRKFGLNPDWVETGAGPWYLKNEAGDYITSMGPQHDQLRTDISGYGGLDNKGIVVTVHSMQCDETDDGSWAPRPLGKLNVPQSFALPSVKVLKTAASSMEPLVRKNAFVGVDTDRKDILSGEVYAIFIPNEGMALKRAYLEAEHDRYALKSENPTHPVLYLPVDKREARVFGRAVWVLQEI